MPPQISLGTAIDIALKAELKRDHLGTPEGVVFDARPEEVYQTLQLLVREHRENQWLKDELMDMSAQLRTASDLLYATAVELP